MIQRIQSLYLFLYIIIKCFLLYLSTIERNLFHFFIDGFDLYNVLLIFLVFLSALTLFSFKKRKIQIKISYLLIMIQLILLILISVTAYKADNSIKFLENCQPLLYFLGLLLLLLSIRGIKKDQNIIDSIDRIR
jgi:peptidoglycan/LPS O-acetylase OafA/YrhL